MNFIISFSLIHHFREKSVRVSFYHFSSSFTQLHFYNSCFFYRFFITFVLFNNS